MTAAGRAAAAAAALALASCAMTGGAALSSRLETANLPAVSVIENAPFFPQTEHHCGPAALSTLLVHSGVETTPRALAPMVYLPGREGTLAAEMAAAPRRLDRMPYLLDGTAESIAAEVAAGRPVAVLLNLGTATIPRWHYAVVIGYDGPQGSLLLHSGREKGKRVPAARFMRFWKGSGFWSMVVVVPGHAPATARKDFFFREAATFERTGTAPAAEAVWRKAALLWPGSPVPHLGLGNSLTLQARYEEAEDSYRTALALDVPGVAALNNLAHVLSLQGCHEEALAIIEEAASRAAEEHRAALVAETRREILGRRKAKTGVADCRP